MAITGKQGSRPYSATTMQIKSGSLNSGKIPTVQQEEKYRQELATAKARQIQRIKDSYTASLNGTFNTGVNGIKVKNGTSSIEELVPVIMPFDRNSIQALKAKAVIIAENYSSGGEEGDTASTDFTDNEKLALYCGFLPGSALLKLKNIPVVIKDADNNFVQVSFIDLLRIAHLMECQASLCLDRKWTLESLIEDSSSIEDIQNISWESSTYDDLDTHGE